MKYVLKIFLRTGWFCLLFGMLILSIGMACAEGSWSGGTVSGCAWLDADGSYTPEGENRLSGVAVGLLCRYADGHTETLSALTDDQGQFCFADLPTGEYQVFAADNGADYLALPVPCEASADGFGASAAFLLNENNTDILCDVAVLPCTGLSCEAYVDANGDGARGKYDRELTGVTLSVLLNDQAVYTASTDLRGRCVLPMPQDASVRVTLPDGYAFSPIGAQNDVTADNETGVIQPDGKTQIRVACVTVGSLSGTAFEDSDNNGVWDKGEPGVAGITVKIRGNKNNVNRETVTDENGVYRFSNLMDGTYTISAELPDGLLFARYSKLGGDLRSIFSGETLEREYTIKKSCALTNKNIGVIQKGTIQGTAFLDLNYNGEWDEGEPGYAGVTVEATRGNDDLPSGKTLTDANGFYAIENLRGGNYRVRAILPKDDSIFSAVGSGDFSTGNLFEQRAARREFTIQPVTIASGDSATVLVGVALGATVSGTLFEDENYNGIYDRGEKTLTGLEVKLFREDGTETAETMSMAKGAYTFTDIMPGNYILQVQRKTGYGFTRLRADETGGSVITGLSGNVGKSEPFSVLMGETRKNLNAGMLPAATVSGKLYNDADDDGTGSAAEGGLTTAVVRLSSVDAETDVTAEVLSDGSFSFDGLMPGQYTLRYELASYCEMTAGNSAESQLKISMGEKITLPDALAVTLGSYCGRIYEDRSGTAISGARVSIGEQNAVTGADGVFRIENLRPGDYALTVELPDSYIFAHSGDLYGMSWPAAAAVTQPVSWNTLTCRDEMRISAVKAAAIRGTVWMDENKDGLQAENEWIMEGLQVELWSDSSDSAVAAVMTDGNGFAFDQVRPGTYTVRFTLPEQCTPAEDAASTFVRSGSGMAQYDLTVREGDTLEGLTTGLISTTSLGGSVILEVNGIRETISGAVLELVRGGTVVATVQTDENGRYAFDGLWPDTYTVRCHQPDGMIFVRGDDPDYAGENLFIERSEGGLGNSTPVTLKMAQHELNHDVLLIKPGKVGDQAWLDVNQNGLIDANEPLLRGVKVRLVQDGQVCYEMETNDQGYYLFNDVYPGSYILQAAAYDSLMPTKQVEALRIISTCLISGDGALAESAAFRVESGTVNPNFDLGYVLVDGQQLPDSAYAQFSRDWSMTHNNMIDGLV